MTFLRQQFIQDLQLRNRSPKTIAVYVMHVRNFARFFYQTALPRTAPVRVDGGCAM